MADSTAEQDQVANSGEKTSVGQQVAEACIEDKEAAANWAGSAAGGATTFGMPAAGAFAYGGALASTISGNLPAAYALEAAGNVLVNPVANVAASSTATLAVHNAVENNWEAICGVVGDTTDFVANPVHPSYVDAKLGYDPAVTSAPTFDIPAAEPAVTNSGTYSIQQDSASIWAAAEAGDGIVAAQPEQNPGWMGVAESSPAAPTTIQFDLTGQGSNSQLGDTGTPGIDSTTSGMGSFESRAASLFNEPAPAPPSSPVESSQSGTSDNGGSSGHDSGSSSSPD